MKNKEKIEIPFYGILLILCSISAFSITIDSNIWALLFFPLLITAQLVKYRVKTSKTGEYLIYSAIIALVVFLYFLLPIRRDVILPIIKSVTFYISMFSILSSLFLIIKKKQKQDLLTFYFYSTAIIIISGFTTENRYFEVIVFFYLVLSAFYLRDYQKFNYSEIETKQPAKSPWFLIALITGLLYFQANLFLVWLEPKFNNLYLPEISSDINLSSFADKISLNDIRNFKLSKKVILRVFAKIEPERLRCKVYTDFLNNSWIGKSIKQLAETSNTDKIALDNDFKYIHKTGYNPLNLSSYSYRIISEDYNNKVFYAIPETFVIKSNFPQIYIDQFEIFYPPENSSQKLDYIGMIFPNLPQKINETNNSIYLNVPPNLKPFLFNYLKQMKPQMKSYNTYQKCQFIQNHFHNNFEYSLDFKKPNMNDDPILNFFYSKKGHCEYFATAMVMLLRMQGIPSRYVVGFLVREYNNGFDYYVVRERDTHAWVEAYIPPKGWTTFDPTPPGGTYQDFQENSKPSVIDEIIDFISFKINEIKYYLLKCDYKALFKVITEGLSSLLKLLIKYPIWGIILLSVLLGLILIKKIRSLYSLLFKKNATISKDKERVLSDDEIFFKDIIKKFDAILSKKDLKRPQNMTLLEFCIDLENKKLSQRELKLIRDFTNNYYLLRYNKENLDITDKENLNTFLKKLQK